MSGGVEDPRSLAGKTAIVTGGGRGIGRAIAAELARAGANIIITYRENQSLADAVARDLQGQWHADVRAMQCDVREGQDIDRVVNEARMAFGGVNILVNNAGMTADNLVMRMSEQAWDDVLDTNLRGTFLSCKAAVRHMLKERWGRIINITSVVGVAGNPGQANYCAAKAGMIGFSKSLGQEIASRNVTVNCVAPGFIESDMTEKLNDKQKDAIMGAIPMKRMGKGAEIASAVAWLASDGAGYVTGQTIHVNGGMA
ncbi:MAG: 3-oxoacyl-[acyl-carrier-protein] reductase, partial [Dehalococcoidia bacterium]|nr:3-oxoacyl-[acyl-carrier-protein] reductase [Dehalococcoidia bacterium]